MKPFGAVLPLVFHSKRFSVPPFVAACIGLQITRSTRLLNELFTFEEEIAESLHAGPPLELMSSRISVSHNLLRSRLLLFAVLNAPIKWLDGTVEPCQLGILAE
jgi:hypothetical protein